MSGADFSGAWLRSMIQHGETAIEMRLAGRTWTAIADTLHLGDVYAVQKAAALYLASDYEARKTAQEGAGAAHPRAVTERPGHAPRSAGAAG